MASALRSRTDQSRATESDVTVYALNRMLKLESLISPEPRQGRGYCARPTDPRNTAEESTS